MKAPSKQQLKDRITLLENTIKSSLDTTDPAIGFARLAVQWDYILGGDLRDADIDAKVARRQELGLSTVCTPDELDATPMETADV